MSLFFGWEPAVAFRVLTKTDWTICSSRPMHYFRNVSVSHCVDILVLENYYDGMEKVWKKSGIFWGNTCGNPDILILKRSMNVND